MGNPLILRLKLKIIGFFTFAWSSNPIRVYLFLKLRHWQLFCMFLALSMAGVFLIELALLYLFAFTGWLYAITISLNETLASEDRKKNGFFRFSCLFYVLFLGGSILISGGGYSITTRNYAEFGALLWILLPLNLYSTFSAFYILYRAAKAISMAGTKREPRSENATSTWFMALMFYPIGIWSVQPKVQRLLAANSQKDMTVPDSNG